MQRTVAEQLPVDAKADKPNLSPLDRSGAGDEPADHTTRAPPTGHQRHVVRTATTLPA